MDLSLSKKNAVPVLCPMWQPQSVCKQTVYMHSSHDQVSLGSRLLLVDQDLSSVGLGSGSDPGAVDLNCSI
jgi:hypothetical protein